MCFIDKLKDKAVEQLMEEIVEKYQDLLCVLIRKRNNNKPLCVEIIKKLKEERKG